MNRRDPRRLFERHRPPRPSDALGRSVVQAAREAARPAEPVSLSDRFWFDRRLRLSWVATLILLVVAQIAAAGSTERRLRGLVDPPAGERISPAAAAARELGFEPTGSMRHVPAFRAAGPSRVTAELD